MAYASGITQDFWSKYYQRRAQKGGGLSASEMASLYEPMGAYDYQKSLAAEERARLQANQDRDFALRTQAQEDAAAAAKVSGVTSMVGTGANIYLGKRLLDIYGKGGAKVPEASATTGGFAGGETGLGPAFSEAPAVAPSVAASYGGAPLAEAAPGSITAGVSGLEYGSGVAPGAANVGAAALPIAGEGAQAGLAAGGGADVASLAAYDASMAEGAAAGVGTVPATTSLLGTGASALGYGALGYTAGDFVAKAIEKWSPIGGEKEKSIAGNVVKGAGAGAGVGMAVGGPIGAVIGGAIGGIVGLGVGLVEDASVICSELLRQGRISAHDRERCVIFRFRFIPDDIFAAYLEWAEPIVKVMRRGGIGNRLLLPFAHAFIGYMLAIQAKRIPSFAERMVWKYAWGRCTKIVRRDASFLSKVRT